MTKYARTAYETEREGASVQELVTEHLDLVKRIIYQLPPEFTISADREDLISAGTLGLVEAAHRYDESRGTSFVTFVYQRIKGAVVDYLRRNDLLSKSARGRVQMLRRRSREFRAQHGRSPTIPELAQAVDLPEETVVKFLGYERWDRVGSLATTLEDSEGQQIALAALIPGDMPTPVEKLERQEQIQRLRQAIERLPERQQQLIVMYYYEELYMREIAEVFGVSESRVSQLHTRAIYNLGRMLE